VEVQGTAEGDPFSRELMDELLAMAREGIEGLFEAQKLALDKIGISLGG
jgi:ribonuclease PH